jgi:hypothetical protein
VDSLLLAADDRGRLSLARLEVRPGDTFRAEPQPDGGILLTPMVAIPARELMVWENKELRSSLLSAMEQAAAGEIAVNQEMEADLAALGEDG